MSLSELLSKYSTKVPSTTLYACEMDTPVGKVIAVADDEYLYIVSFEDSKNFEKKLQAVADELFCKFVEKQNSLLLKFELELKLYFEAGLKKFTIPIKTFGSEFQKEVWQKLQELPYGSTQTYGDIAKALGRPASHSRAVGAACGANAHLLVIPCHRVVATNTKGGFSCGVDRKEWLLAHETKNA
ncbi:6-O-methylguanine DNA methyltransferase, DNA binding domain-containing protein [Phthorimaea operculella]|nr:6-O-methylguanine DNA methyltransferase, DNA binding domain-containing protein [Phthorimaea operculella]